MATPGLRARKKERTRAEIVRVARELFAERGYQATTIADIAEGADIATSTVFGYFATKDEILFAHHRLVLDDQRAWLEEHAGTKPALELIRDYLLTRLPELVPPDSDWHRTLRTIVGSDPRLAAEEHLRILEYQQVFADALARDAERETDGVRFRIAAAMALAGFSTGRLAVAAGQAEPGPTYDHVLRFLEAGYAAVAPRAARA